MVWQSYPVLPILLLLILSSLLICWILMRIQIRVAKDNRNYNKKQRTFWGILIFLALGLGIFGNLGQFPLRWSDAFSLGSDYKASLALNPFQSFFSSLKFRGRSYDKNKVRHAYTILAPYYGLNPSDSIRLDFSREMGPAVQQIQGKNPPNIVVVICESFSAYKSSMWGNPLNTTPFFDSLSHNGIFFDHCFTPTYGTARGVWAVVTGIPDVEIGTTTSSRNPSAVDQHSIINDFKGYSKYYFIGGSTSWANIRGLLTNNITGLHLYEQKDYSSPKIDVWGISDKNLFLEANQRLKQATSPFIAVIQTADNHRPYSIPEEDLKNFHKIEMPENSLRQYGFESNDEMNAFRYTDFVFKTFMEAALQEKYFDNTLFLFVGDHGIAGNAGNMFPNAWTEDRLTMEHVPLLIYSPKLVHPLRIDKPCSQVDVMPTLAGLAGIPYLNSTLGRNLLDSNHDSTLSFSFIYNPDEEYIGLIKGDYFFRNYLKTGKKEMTSLRNNEPVPEQVLAGPLFTNMNQLSSAFYEASKYLLLNNKKRP
jgi:phosphoglycerol transferase MdoB-like AlkP superfamily enzyme